jgi:AcrR family transcriptional regulator
MARPASDIAERVLAAARARFLSEGVDGASLRAIARDAGTNLGMVYYYYPTKDALFMAVVEEVYTRLLDDIGRVLDEAGASTEARIERLYQRLASADNQELEVLRLIIREALGSSERLTGLFERFSRGHIPMLLSLVTGAQAGGEVRQDIPPLVAVLSLLSLGVVPQLMRRRLADVKVNVSQMIPGAPELAQLLANVLLRGIQVAVVPVKEETAPT